MPLSLWTIGLSAAPADARLQPAEQQPTLPVAGLDEPSPIFLSDLLPASR